VTSPPTPEHLAPALALVADLDRVLAHGLARIAAPEQAALKSLAQSLAATPLGPTLAEAVPALLGGELLAHHLVALAMARAALLGAAHDALLEAATRHLGYTLAPDEPQLTPPAPAHPTRVLMDSAQQWLVELALAGFAALDRATVQPALAALRPLQEHPPLRRLAALMTGFANELLDLTPTSTMPALPLTRWADLWTVAILQTVALPSPSPTTPVSGVLTPLGLDLRHHDHLVSAVVHAALTGDTTRLVRIHLSAWKVDAIAGVEALSLLVPQAPNLMGAWSTPASFEVQGLSLSRAGDLTWDDRAPARDPAPVTLSGALVARPEPRDRHPLHLALPIVGPADRLGDLPTRGASPWLELDELHTTKGATFTSLLRWDAGWFAQPMVAATKKGPKGLADAFARLSKVKDFALPVLQERASRLLRKS
jgi:hypothetical protein